MENGPVSEGRVKVMIKEHCERCGKRHVKVAEAKQSKNRVLLDEAIEEFIEETLKGNDS